MPFTRGQQVAHRGGQGIGHAVDRDGGNAAGLVNHLVLLAVGKPLPRPIVIAEQCQARRPLRRGQMHRSAVVTDQQSALFQDGC